MEKASVASLLNVSYKDNIKPQEWFLSFSPYKCFPTFAVWKHFSICPYPRTGSLYLTANSSFSSLSPLPRQGDGRKPHSLPIQMGWATLLCHSNSEVFVRHDTPLHLHQTWLLQSQCKPQPALSKDTRRMKLLDSNEIRQLRDVCIFEVNGMEVYM